jgi:hypothetical protein
VTVVLLTAAVSLLGLAVTVLALRLRTVAARARRFRRAAWEADRALAAFVNQAVEDFYRQDGGSW